MEFLETLASGWWGWIAPLAWQATLLAVFVWLADRGIRRWAWPQLIHALWLLVLLRMVLPPSLGSPISIANLLPVNLYHYSANRGWMYRTRLQ